MTVKVTGSLAAKWPNVKRGVEDIMGGAILELEIDKIVEKALEKELEKAVDEAVKKAETETAKKTVADTMVSLVRDGLLDAAEGARRANMTREEFEQGLNDI